MGPCVRAIDVAVLHRVVMNVIQMAIAIVFVSNRVFPKPALPDAARPLADAGAESRLLAAAGGEVASREGGLDQGEPPGKIRVAIGQRDEQMQMTVQQHDRLQHKWVQRAAMLDGVAKQYTGGFVCEEGGPAFGDEGEEECAAGLNRPPIVGQELNVNYDGSPGNKRWASTPTLHGFIRAIGTSW